MLDSGMSHEIIQRVAARFIRDAAAKKLGPTQLEVLLHPDRIRTTTQEKNADKLVELGFLEKKPHPSNPDLILYNRTKDGGDYLRALEAAKDKLTPENIYEVARKFPNFTHPRIDITRLWIFLTIRDPERGITVVDTVERVPSDKEIDRIVKDMQKEFKYRAQSSRY